MTNLRISVALCTYNGARYIKEQLDSIHAQTRQPDELIICDDCSTDNTVEVVNEFIKNPDFPTRFIINDRNRGSSKNFEKAISLCTGDIIVLSDQDDYWYPKKLEIIQSAFSSDQDIGLVFGDADVVDENLRPKGFRFWKAHRFDRNEMTGITSQRAFDVLLRRNVVTGAMMAFRASYKEKILPIPAIWIHDGWISIIISSMARIKTIDEPLIKYRQHPAQQIGALKITYLGVFIRELKKAIKDPKKYNTISNQNIALEVERFRSVYDRICQIDQVKDKTRLLVSVQNKIDHLQTRKRLSNHRLLRLPIIIKEFITLRYHRYSFDAYIVKDML